MSDQTSPRTFFAPIKVPTLNEVLAMCKSRSGWRIYAADKRAYMEVIGYACRDIEPTPGAYRVHFHYYEQDRRRDPDNVAAVGKKYILDALTKAGKIDGDGWKHNRGMSDSWSVAESRADVGVQVTIKPMETD